MNVTVQNNLYGRKTQIVYSGEEMPLPKWVEYPAIALSTGDRQFPVRIIAKNNIIKINDNIVEPKFVAEPVAKRTIKVTGSKGNTYLVTIDGKYKSCTCSGFQFRRNCRHIVEVQ
jgi:SWIM zinc finger